MEGGQSGTYLRLTRASSGLRVSVGKTYSTAEEGLCVWTKIFIFISFHLFILATLTCGPDDALVCLNESAALSAFHFCLFHAFAGFPFLYHTLYVSL